MSNGERRTQERDLEEEFRNSLIVPLSNIAGHQFGLDRNAKYRALHWLE